MDLKNELRECQAAAEEGYQLVQGKYDEIKTTLTDAAQKLSQTDAEQNKVNRIRNTELIAKQKEELQRLRNRIDYIGGDLQNLRKRTKDFSIVVYGRTMAGKSTLMEILTHGNGKSIGKGSQRTTRDVRDYYWQGLKITDVPGICAFEGAKDERLALEAAKSADLILFLLTSDAPQPDEAACLAQLKSFGKPILGVINVKMNFNINDDLDIEDLEDKLSDTTKINATINQFKQFAAKHNQDWSGIKFVATHLLSAYQAQDKNPKVFKLSRFAAVEEFILEKVKSDGRFLRIKTFADAVAVPMNNIILKIYEYSAASLLASDVWFDKWRQLDEWSKKFLERSQERLNNLYQRLAGELEGAIYNFVENHFEDEKAGEHWKQCFQSLKFDEKYQAFLKEEITECERKRKELSDELTAELKFTLGNKMQSGVQLDDATPWGENFFMGVGAVGSLAAGAGVFLAERAIGVVFPPLGIALGVISILGWIFSDSREEKIRKNKEKLFDAINEPSYKILGEMHSQVVEILNKEVISKGIDEFRDSLVGYQFMLARLGQSQSEMANTLFKEFSNLNAKILEEAIVYKGAGFISSVNYVARIPGEALVAFAQRSKLNTDELSDLLGEKFEVIKPQEDFVQTLKFILGEFDVDTYPLGYDEENKEAEKAVAVFPKNKVNAIPFKIAQQIAGVPIIAEISDSATLNSQAKCDEVEKRNSSWDDVLNSLSTTRMNKIKEINVTTYADAFLGEKIGNMIRLSYKLYYKENGRWLEFTSHKDISSEEIPESLRKKICNANGEIKITDEIERKLAAR